MLDARHHLRIQLLKHAGAVGQPEFQRIVALHRGGISFLVIEHNMDLVMSVCQPIVVMMQGRVVCQGTADEVRADRRVLDAYLGEVPA